MSERERERERESERERERESDRESEKVSVGAGGRGGWGGREGRRASEFWSFCSLRPHPHFVLLRELSALNFPWGRFMEARLGNSWSGSFVSVHEAFPCHSPMHQLKCLQCPVG